MNNFSFYKGGKTLYCLIFFGCLLPFAPVLAYNSLRQQQSNFQQNQIQGIITDGTNPLSGVTIVINSKANSGVISDYNGQYSIAASSSDTLLVSFIGFKTILVPVKGRKNIDIQLQYDTTNLQEVRVNAGYYSVKSSERTGSIARITTKDIETQPVSNVLATMQGRMAGVNVIQSTGVPGGGFEIKIRGQNSIRGDGNAPLYIIDGVPYASDAIGSSRTATTFPTPTSPLNSINPDMIESIEILKDADATAIYGSGLIGHSFGGYETAFIITQTDLFATAIASGAITDLNSFYLTINQKSGKPDMWRFQSEQWRMGKTPFEAPLAYQSNSPIVHAQKIKTPVLLWSGKQDKQVDPHQTTEFYLALHRLGKKNITLFYPNEGHVLTNATNQKDLTVRVGQWFGYFLKDEPPARWIKDGLN